MASELRSALLLNWRDANLRRLQGAWVASITGYWCAGVALAVSSYLRDGSRGLALLAVARFVTPALVGPVGGTLSDRFPRRRVMVTCDLFRAASIGALAITGIRQTAAVLYVLAALMAVMQTGFRTAQAALLPVVSPGPKVLEAANLIATSSEGVGIFLGPALGGVLLGSLGVGAAFGFAALTFLWSAALVTRVDIAETHIDSSSLGLKSMLIDGVKALAGSSPLRGIVGIYAAQTLVAGVMQTLLPLLAFRIAMSGGRETGFLFAAVGIGALAGGAVTGWTLRLGNARVLLVGVLLCGAPLELVAGSPGRFSSLVAMFVVGIGATMADVGAITLLQRVADPALLGRVFGLLEAILLSTLGLGAAIAPEIARLISLRGAFAATGAVLPAVAAVAWVPLLRLGGTQRLLEDRDEGG